MIDRRTLLASALAAPLFGCARSDAAPLYGGGWVGASLDRGHRLRSTKSGDMPAPSKQLRAAVLIVGAGIAGFAAARALARAGFDDVHLLELEDTPGGNSRGHHIAGIACPLGAHYLPLPGQHAHEVAQLLDEFGLTRHEHGRVVADERYLCHSPQERLYIDGHWQEGVLPQPEGDAALLAQYRAFGAAIESLRRQLAFAMPTPRAAWSSSHDALDAIAFAAWLDRAGFNHPKLRWYLDYCCRDDYGAGAGRVSAWAGVHYFASRHGFVVPEEDDNGDGERDAVLTWPEGNAWLVDRLAAPHRERLHTGRVALRVSEGRHDVSVQAWNEHTQQVEQWSARSVVLALPLYVALRLFDAPPAALIESVARMRQAPWLVANLHLRETLADRAGAPPSWDNVAFEGASLGYVDAMHQSLKPHRGPTVLTAYWALEGHSDAAGLLRAPWAVSARNVVQDLVTVHPDLERKLARIDLMRYGHAMSIPLPGVRGSAALRALGEASGRVRFAHSDLSGYSVFEEAFYWGTRAGVALARRRGCEPTPRKLRQSSLGKGH